jgi:hypothetical protein
LWSRGRTYFPKRIAKINIKTARIPIMIQILTGEEASSPEEKSANKRYFMFV